MKSFKQLRGKYIAEETVELAGVTLQNMEHCPGAVSAFKQNLKDGASEKDVAKAAKAVDAYLAIEDKAKKSGATDADVEKMKGLIDTAKSVISDLGLEGHTYHDMHLDRVKKMVKESVKESYEDRMPASPDEKSMAMRQAKFISYVGQEIMEHLQQDNDFPEWMQNKLSALHQKAKDMHATMAGEYEDDEEEMNESRNLKQPGPHPDLVKAKIKHDHHQSPFKKSKTWVTVDKKDYEKAKKILGNKLAANGGSVYLAIEEETLDEVLDTPKAMDSYRNKAKYSRDRAASSATAINFRSKDKPQREHPAKDLKTIAKRTAGLKMADKAAMRKTYKNLRKEEVEIEEAVMSGEEKQAFEAGKKAARAGKDYKNNPHKDSKLKLAWSRGHNQAKARKLGVREETVDEAAPKIKGDWLKKERERNRAHDAAMGRTPTGRKKPVQPMTSTQRARAQLQRPSVKK